VVPNKNWTDLEHEVDKLDHSDNEYKSTVGFLTEDEIAVLTNDVHAHPRSLHELRVHAAAPKRGDGVDNNLYGHHINNNQPGNTNDKALLHKQSILKKLMIAQRKQFMARKEHNEMMALKKKLMADTSISNFSQASEYIKFNDLKKNKNNLNENYKLLYDCWDTARIVDTEETYEQRQQFFNISLQILKVVTYIVLGLVVLAAAVAGKGSLLLMTTAVGTSTSVSFN
jgi:hypothetical protein